MENKEVLDLMNQIKTGVDDNNKRIVEVDGKLIGFDNRLIAVENGLKSRAVSIPGLKNEKQKFSFQKALLAIATGNWEGAEFEQDIFKQTRKALSVGTDTAGGFIVPTEYVAEIIELLRARSVVRELGATMMEGLVGSPVEMPSQDGGAVGYWVAENADITESDQAFGQLLMTPKQAAAMTKMSNRLLRLSNPAVEGVVRNDIAKTLALLIDLAALRGDGASNNPKGVANTTGINVYTNGADGFVPSIDDLYEMLYKIELANADGGKMGFAFHPRTWNTLRKLKDAENRYYLVPDPTQANKGTLMGFPYKTTTQIPINIVVGASGEVCSEIYLGNWEELLIGQWGGMELLASQQAGDAFAKNQTWVRIIQEVDVGVRHPKAFCYTKGAKV